MLLESLWPVKSLIYHMKNLEPKCLCSFDSQGLLFGSILEFSWCCHSLNSTSSDWAPLLGRCDAVWDWETCPGGIPPGTPADVTAVLCCVQRGRKPHRLGHSSGPPILLLDGSCFRFSLTLGFGLLWNTVLAADTYPCGRRRCREGGAKYVMFENACDVFWCPW